MIILQEINATDYPNHIYHVNDSKSKVLAYIPNGIGELVTFVKPMSFSTTRRKFKVLKKD